MENNLNNKELIKNELIEVVDKLFNIQIDEDSLDEPLLGKRLKLTARDLAYLYFQIKNIWNINISEESIILGKFHTINSIITLIQES
jgi:acyl carrier protein